MRVWGVIAFALALLPPLAAGAQPSQEAGELRAYVVDAMAQWGVPGMAVAVVRDDQVVLAEGYGVRRLGERASVDADTVFAIGSNTKAFTAAVIATEIEAGRMAWDAPVVRYLPDFQLLDPWVTREITIRDLLTHRHGLARGDMLWHGSGLDRTEIIRRMRRLPQRLPFRSRYDYNNLGYIVAGQAAAAAAGKSWDDLVHDRLLSPLGMSRSSTSISALEGMDDLASPHWIENGSTAVMPRMNLDNLGPAGSINSSARDMARWLRFQLADGQADGRPLVAARLLRQTRSAQVTTPTANDPLFPTTHFNAYGMGWALFDYQGRQILQHTGGVDGMQSEMVLVPEARLGFVILTNAEGHDLSRAVMYRLLDLYLAVPERDWSALFLERARADGEDEDDAASVATGASPSRPLQDYAGVYTDPLYGEVAVIATDAGLELTFGPLHRATLTPRSHDAFSGRWTHPRLGTSSVVFQQDAKGDVGGLELGGVGTFVRKPST